MSSNSGPAEALPGGDTSRSYGEGLAIIGLGGLVLSIDIPLIRLSESAFWTVLFVRGVLTCLVTILVWRVDSLFFRPGQKLVPGSKGLAVTLIFALGAATFVYAVFNTSAGNVVFILAFNPMFAALLSWRFIGERPRLATIVAIPATLAGVAMIIWAGLETGNWTGDLAALATAFLTAAALTISRYSRRDMRYASSLGVLLPALIAAPFVAAEGFHSQAIGWLVLNGGVVIPVAMICLALGPLFVPAPVVSMAYLIETVLAPVWVWLIFGERPTDLALLGGVVVVVTLVAHSIAELTAVGRSRRRLGNVRRV